MLALSVSEQEKEFDIAIVGAGVLGVSLYFWLTSVYHLRIVLLEKEERIASHTSSRNTGVIHRPFYLDPIKKRVQARSAGISYSLWADLARISGSPWLKCGTIEVARSDKDLDMLQKYSEWSIRNGLSSSDFSILTGQEVSRIEPEVRCYGAIHSKTDVSTDFGVLTNELYARSGNDVSKIIRNADVLSIEENDSICQLLVRADGRKITIKADTVINAAGGESLELAHRMGYARKHAVLYFRGEYWRVGPQFAGKIQRNIYSVPRHTKYPFLDPHFITRADGTREIGPNAVLVGGPEAYGGLTPGKGNVLTALIKSPLGPKFHLLFNREFLSLVSSEWKSSRYKSEMAQRIRGFIPALEDRFLTERGISGVRASLIDHTGFTPEAVIVFGRRSLHILNYNSPGATGAPAFSVYVIMEMISKGLLKETQQQKNMFAESWNFERITEHMTAED